MIFFQLYEYYEDLMNGLTSVLVRLYITKVKITISEECGIINAIYNQAALLMYKFWDQNVLFSFEMLDIILPMKHTMVDYESLQQAVKTILLRTIIRKTAEYFFYQSVVLKNDEMRKYSERIMIKLNFLVVKLDE